MARIITFYSYKGGTGRSMALANFAWILAANGKKVLTVDWDLDAPGLHRYFRPFLIDPDLVDTNGLIDLFWTFTASALARAPTSETNIAATHLESPEPSTRGTDELDGAPDGTELVIDRPKRRLKWTFPSEGFIDFVGAGRQGATYSERVNTFDWKRFYELGGAQALEKAKALLHSQYDWVLIDSRTGVSDTAGVCTMQLPDTVVACFTLNRQSIDGVSSVLRSIRNYRSTTVNGANIRFFPLATRIENAEQGKLEVARRYARGIVAEFLPDSPSSEAARSYWAHMELAYRPAYAFEEVLAIFGDASDVASASDTLLFQIERMSQRVAEDPDLRAPEIVESDRATVLSRYALGPPLTANAIEPAAPAETALLRQLAVKEQEWRTGGFSWRDLMSRRELDLITQDDRQSFGRNMTFYLTNSERAQRLFRYVDATFFLSLVLTVVGVAIAIVLLKGNTIYESQLVIGATIYIGVFCWPFVAMLFGIIISSFVDKPYGISPKEVGFLVLRGPFRQAILDYEDPGRAKRKRRMSQ